MSICTFVGCFDNGKSHEILRFFCYKKKISLPLDLLVCEIILVNIMQIKNVSEIIKLDHFLKFLIQKKHLKSQLFRLNLPALIRSVFCLGIFMFYVDRDDHYMMTIFIHIQSQIMSRCKIHSRT